MFIEGQISKMLDDLIVCCDDKRVLMHAQKHNVKCMMTKKLTLTGLKELPKHLKNEFELQVYSRYSGR